MHNAPEHLRRARAEGGRTGQVSELENMPARARRRRHQRVRPQDDHDPQPGPRPEKSATSSQRHTARPDSLSKVPQREELGEARK